MANPEEGVTIASTPAEQTVEASAANVVEAIQEIARTAQSKGGDVHFDGNTATVRSPIAFSGENIGTCEIQVSWEENDGKTTISCSGTGQFNPGIDPDDGFLVTPRDLVESVPELTLTGVAAAATILGSLEGGEVHTYEPANETTSATGEDVINAVKALAENDGVTLVAADKTSAALRTLVSLPTGAAFADLTFNVGRAAGKTSVTCDMTLRLPKDVDAATADQARTQAGDVPKQALTMVIQGAEAMGL